MIFPEGFGHDGQGEQAQHILFVRLREFDSHGQRGDGFHRGALVHQTKLRHAFGHKFMKGERHVAGANRRTVVKTRPRINRDFCPAEIIGVTHVLRDQGIIAAGLVVGGDEQRVIEGFGTRCRYAAQGKAVKVVKCSRGGKRHVSAFRGGWVDVIVVVKVNRVLRLANDGKGRALFDGLRLARQAHQRQQRQHNAHNHSAADPFVHRQARLNRIIRDSAVIVKLFPERDIGLPRPELLQRHRAANPVALKIVHAMLA